MCWAMIGCGVGFALREDLPGAGDVVSESVRASQEEIWPLKGVDGWMGSLREWHEKGRGQAGLGITAGVGGRLDA